MKETMFYVYTAFLSALRLLFRRKRWIAPLFLPVLITIPFLLLSPQERAAPVQVGVALTDASGESFRELIGTYSGAVVTFLPANVETLERNVAISRWDCGLIVGADFDQRLQEQDTDGLITLVIGAGSTVYPLVQETAAACLAKQITPYLAEAYLEKQGMPAAQEFPSVERVEIKLSVLDGSALELEQMVDSLWDELLFGVLAAAAALYALLIAVDLGRWLDSAAGRMECRLRGAGLCTLPRLLAALCPAVCGVALVSLPLHGQAMLAELFGLLLALGAVGLLLCRHPVLWKPLPLFLPLVCPVALFYVLLPVRLPCWAWFLGAVVLMGLSVCFDRPLTEEA